MAPIRPCGQVYAMTSAAWICTASGYGECGDPAKTTHARIDFIKRPCSS